MTVDITGNPDKLTWEKLCAADPRGLLTLSPKFTREFPPFSIPKQLTVGMAAHGNVGTTLVALRALLASIDGDVELILVDDASPDETGALFELVETVHPNTKVFRFPRNIEYNNSLNTILSHAVHDHILFISNDIYITPSYLQQLFTVMESDGRIGVVRGCSNFVDNGLALHNIKDFGRIDNFEALFTYGVKRAQLYDGQLSDDPFLTGDAFMINRCVLNEVGYVDPRFYGYFGDHDLGVRARRAGFRTVLALGAFAWHQHGSNIDYLAPREKERKIRNRWARVNENWARFKEKYGLPPEQPYKSMKMVPWDLLCRGSIQDLEKPTKVDQSRFLVPARNDLEAWKQHQADEIATYARKMQNYGELQAAETLCRKGLKSYPSSASLLTVLGTALAYGGKPEEAIKTFRSALRHDPAHVKAHSNLIFCMNYSSRYTQREIFRESKKWARQHGVNPDGNVAFIKAVAKSRLRIGFVSPDLCRHSVSYFLLPLLKGLRRDLFEAYFYSDADVSSHDEVTDNIILLSDGWRDIHGLDDDVAAGIIRDDSIDVLVDLAGHTGQRIRLTLFSRRMAPVQATWLGYPNTSGLATIDYRISDCIADPPECADSRLYSEKVYRLKGCFLCYDPPLSAPDVAESPFLKLGTVTFGSFNNLVKITDEVIACWSRILLSLPGSRLVLKNHYLRDTATARRFHEKFVKNGLDGERVILKAPDPDTATHLGRYAGIDIALDTFPYNGATTTCEALWMGTPVVTMRGERHSARVGATILQALGRDELVADTLEGYHDMAVALASDPKRLSALRGRLRREMRYSELCDAERFAEEMGRFFISAYELAINHWN